MTQRVFSSPPSSKEAPQIPRTIDQDDAQGHQVQVAAFLDVKVSFTEDFLV